MDATQGRRLVALLLLCGCFLLTSWLETICSVGNVVMAGGATRSKRSVVVGSELRNLLKEARIKGDSQYEDARRTLLQQYQAPFLEGPPTKEQPGRSKNKNVVGPTGKKPSTAKGNEPHDKDSSKGDIQSAYELLTDQYEEIEDAYMTAIEERAREIRRKVYKCLPKFICEVHSQGAEKITTELERDWLNMYSSPGLLADSSQQFQTAAHMGQLFRGYQPSPCHQLYTNCPITMDQLKKFLALGDFKKPRYF